MIGPEGEQLGVLAIREAQKAADAEGMDLVEISSTAHPPVCRIMDLGRFKYEQAKNTRRARRRNQATTLKEMRYRPKIDKHDIEFKTKHVRSFLQAGHKVKVYVEFRGREMTHTEFGVKILSQVEGLLADVGAPENRPKMEGRHMTMLFVPLKSILAKKKEQSTASQPVTTVAPAEPVTPVAAAQPVTPVAPAKPVTPPTESGPAPG